MAVGSRQSAVGKVGSRRANCACYTLPYRLLKVSVANVLTADC